MEWEANRVAEADFQSMQQLFAQGLATAKLVELLE